jgi:UPF0755 protein
MRFKMAIIFFGLVASGALFLFYERAVNAPGPLGQEITVEIKVGESVGTVINNFKIAGVLTNPWLAQLYFWHRAVGRHLQAGSYRLPAGTSLVRLVKILQTKPVPRRTATVLITEGLTADVINDRLKSAQIITDDSFWRLVRAKRSSLPAAIAELEIVKQWPEQATLEGLLFPDTYNFYQGETGETVLLAMLANFQKQWQQAKPAALKASKLNLFQIVTLASIVQREVASAKDMSLVAGVFYNRLGENRPLESCATLAYVLGINKAQYNQEDTETPSLYNTYLHSGLPPGPIGNPGWQAIAAVLEPTKSDYLYFLTRSDNGQTIFAKSLPEHNLNRAKYLD